MADLAAAGSAVGIVSLGIQVCQGLLSYYNEYKDYESDISGTCASVADLRGTLALLKQNLIAGGLDNKRTAQVSSCLQSCTSGLQDLGTKLDELKKYSKPLGLRQKARFEWQKAVYPFRKDTLDKLRGNVADVRERLKLALQVLELSVLQSDRWRKIVDWLSPADPWTYHHSARDRHEPGTGDWLLQSPTYLDWKAGKSRHLWICGKAGCGKTVLSSTMIEDIKKLCGANENLGRFGLGAFYFTFSDERKQSYEDLLRSLVEQLAWKQDSFARLQQAYDSPDHGRPGKDELEKILLLSLRAYDQVFLALDALDESPEENDTRQMMLEQLERLVQNTTNVKLLATSREVRDIQESMGMLKAKRINVADSKVDKDIRRYVVSELSKDRRLSRLSDKTTSLIEDTLSARADGMTPLTLRELAEAAVVDPSDEGKVDVDNRGDIDDSVDILSGLILVYEEDNGYETDDSYDTDEEDDGDKTVDSHDTHDSQNLSSTHVSRCSDDADTGSFTHRFNSESTVRLAHFSVKEYLDSERILDGAAKDFHLDAASEHRFLAQSCLTYLMHYSNDTTTLPTASDKDAYPLLDYSANTWYYHSSLQNDGELEREVRMLTSPGCLRCWLHHDHELQEKQSRLNDFKAGQSIYFATYVGLSKVVKLLLERGADVNESEGYYGGALQAASYKGYKDIVELLSARGADANASGGYYGSALQAASIKGYEDIVELLLAKGADANASGGYYGTALQAAAACNSIEVVKRLVATEADVNAQGGPYGNALQAAASNGFIEVVERLLTAGVDVNAQGGRYGNALQAAADFEDSLELVERLLTAGANVNAQGGEFGNALQAAARGGSIEVVERLLAAGADVHVQGGFYGNALQAAAFLGAIEVVERLLTAGADVNAQGGDYGNALQAAVFGGPRVVERLLAAGADVNVQGGFYGNALQAAAFLGSVEVVERLLTAGADVDTQGGYYGNALQAAATSIPGSVKKVERLLAAGADVNAQGGFYCNALKAAKDNGYGEIVDMLLAAGAVPMEDDQLSVESEELERQE